ncbi:MAG TPA: LPS assembly lipoprotein LptE [Pirellulales bacterium]|nr:LPS assembly lipoprotein LptE [Pirellulales bacterium]
MTASYPVAGAVAPRANSRVGGRLRHTACAFDFAVLALWCGFASGCAGYHVGAASLYPPDVHTVYVPVIVSLSYRRYLGERLTEAVVKRIEEVTPFKVVHYPPPRADSVLTCQIVSESKSMVMTSPTSEMREGQIAFQITVTWTGRNGSELKQDTAVPLPTINQSSNMFPELGQSITTSQQQTIDKLAKQIVGMMETPW